MKTKLRKSLWLFGRKQDAEPGAAPPPVGNPIVQAAYSATMLKEEREQHELEGA